MAAALLRDGKSPEAMAKVEELVESLQMPETTPPGAGSGGG
jgi:hypothetical protein